MSLPTMNNRLNRREEMLSRILAPRPVSEATPPQDRIATNDGHSQTHRHTTSHTTSAPSFESSACSDPDTVTNYGIARALNAEIIVPNADNPIATMKDRKSASYMEKLDERRRALLGEVDKALAILRELPDLRSKGTKDLLFHSKFLEANASLAQHTRAYNNFFQDLKELRDLPKMSRQELEWRYTFQKQQKKGEYKDTNTAAVQQQISELESQIADLALEREDFEDQNKILSQRLQRYSDNIDQLMEDKGYFEHLLVECKRALIDTETELGRLSEQLASSQIVARDSKEQLSFATSHVDQLNDKNRALSEEVKSLRDQNAELHKNAGHLHAEATSLIDGREEAEEDRANQRLQIRELEEDIADYQDENAQLKAELALLKSGTARRDSVVDEGSPGEGPRSTSA